MLHLLEEALDAVVALEEFERVGECAGEVCRVALVRDHVAILINWYGLVDGLACGLFGSGYKRAGRRHI